MRRYSDIKKKNRENHRRLFSYLEEVECVVDVYVCPVDGDVAVPVRPLLLVTHPQQVEQLVGNHVLELHRRFG